MSLITGASGSASAAASVDGCSPGDHHNDHCWSRWGSDFDAFGYLHVRTNRDPRTVALEADRAALVQQMIRKYGCSEATFSTIFFSGPRRKFCTQTQSGQNPHTKWALFSTFRFTYLSIGGDRNQKKCIFELPGPCPFEWYRCCCFDLLSLKVDFFRGHFPYKMRSLAFEDQ